MLGFIEDCITQDLQESQSKLINARWIGLATAVDESSVTVFRDGLIRVDLCECQQITKTVTYTSYPMYDAIVALFLNIAVFKQIAYFLLQGLIEVIVELILFLLDESLTQTIDLDICVLFVALNSSKRGIVFQNQTNHFILHGPTEKNCLHPVLLVSFSAHYD